jgi:hypothetical protein
MCVIFGREAFRSASDAKAKRILFWGYGAGFIR